MQACPVNASCHLGMARTQSMLEQFYWWIGMNISTRWWLRHCLQCRARKSSRQTACWPTLSLPLLSSPGIAISVDYFGPLPVAPKGNSYILLFTDRLTRRTDMYSVSAADLTAEGTADKYISSTNTSLGGDAALVSSPTTASSSDPSCLTLFTSCTACAKLRQAPIILTETVVSRA